MKIQLVREADLPRWRELAREVEPLFGPMVGEPGFEEAMVKLVGSGEAIGLSDDGKIKGIGVIAKETNSIVWLAVTKNCRGQGVGKFLMEEMIRRLDLAKAMRVQTFADEVKEGKPARRLYESMGFRDVETAGQNSAGVPTVIMEREPGAFETR